MDRSDRTGPGSPEAQALLQLMEQISEEYWAAAWLTDLEHLLWRLARGDSEGIAPAWPSSEGDGVELRRLFELCQGWWAWDEAVHDVRFVPLEVWRSRAEAHAGA